MTLEIIQILTKLIIDTNYNSNLQLKKAIKNKNKLK